MRVARRARQRLTGTITKRLATPEELSRYRDDPVAYARERLGFDPWDDGSDDSQALFMMAVAAFARVAVRSGHKTGKSGAFAVLALWWYETRIVENAKVIITAPTDKQVREVTWLDIRKLFRQARVRIPGKLNMSPQAGLRGPGEARIIGYVSKSADAFSGPSGAAMLYLVDEAAGFDAALYEALEGSTGGGGKVVFAGNPTQVSGPFFDAFHSKSKEWVLFHFSSRRVIEWQERTGRTIPGLATREWMERLVRSWGLEDARTAVRINGDFPTNESSAVIPLGLITEAAARVFVSNDPMIDRMVPIEVGVDVARYGDDKSAIAVRRGGYTFPIKTQEKKSGTQLAPLVIEYAVECQTGTKGQRFDPRLPRPKIKVDGNGVGAALVDALNAHPSRKQFDLIDVNSSRRANDENEYANVRAEMTFGVRLYLERGGNLPDDEELREDLRSQRYTFDKNQKLQIENKDAIKARIGRSPDKGDALAMAVYDAADVTGTPVPL